MLGVALSKSAKEHILRKEEHTTKMVVSKKLVAQINQAVSSGVKKSQKDQNTSRKEPSRF